MKRHSGIALTIAVCFAMVCFLLATAMVSICRQDLRATTGKALSTRRYFAARGQVQELIALINAGHKSLTEHTESAKLRTVVDEVEVLSWVVIDKSEAGVCHVFAQAGGELSQSVVALTAPIGGGSFASIMDNEDESGFAVPVHFLSQASELGWTPLTDPPHRVYVTPTETFLDNTVKISRRYASDDQGHLYASTICYDPPGVGLYRYDPVSRAWTDLGPVPALSLDGLSDQVASHLGQASPGLAHPKDGGEQLTVTRSGTELFDCTNAESDDVAPGGHDATRSLLRRLDLRSGKWSLVKGPSNGIFTSLAGKAESGVVGILELNHGSGGGGRIVSLVGGDTWETLPQAPYFDSVAVGPKGEIYVVGGGKDGLSIARYDGGNWTPIAAPSGATTVGLGLVPQLLSVDSEGAILCRLGLGEACARLVGDAWQPLPAVPVGGASEEAGPVIGGGISKGGSDRLVKTISR